ncbi:16S rRNA (uracil(1498)-N(3))-methyltransferase [Ammonifex thiophilus]|uniref:Ribosomal RNA small subunit methyltransferase E n=1 Tax=Ammonifex thiophilus TaxID=444093 RepID=A0A3D8P3D1_9THEO|nr:16S rRNA (uracil(1498)-N(3))-methyltransferase [Ammonifex thiophilus]RDV81285.1 16S rRNA (uracil(1498)-N(3))-methyltransferase [Ammonifex thiophilus]
MRRVFVLPEELGETKVVLPPEESHYLLSVLRLRAGDRVAVHDGEGRARAGIILRENGGRVEVELGEYLSLPPEPPVFVTLFQGIPKGEKMDLVVQKATELGVSRIVPLLTERVVVQWDRERARKRRERWQRLAREAVRQCGRSTVPRIKEVTPLSQALEELEPETVGIMPWEGERSLSLRSCLHSCRPRRVALFIGPEGGFSEREVALAQKRGVFTVTLGPRILRTETAGLAALALVLYGWGDLGGENKDW